MSDPLWVGAAPANFTVGRSGQVPIALVQHVMLGTLGTTRAAFHNPTHQASAHYGIGRDGTVHQYVRDEDTAYSNGNLRNPALLTVPWLRSYQTRGDSPNPATISLEYEGTHTGAEWTFVPWNGAQLQTIRAGSITRWWTPTEAQYQAGRALCQRLATRWHIPLDRAHICRHSDFDSITRWFCPGTGYDVDRLIADLQRGVIMSNLPPPATTSPPLVWDGVTVPLAVGARLAALGALRLPTCGKVLRAGLWAFPGLGEREVVVCEGIVLVALPENAIPFDVQKALLDEAIKIKRTLGV